MADHHRAVMPEVIPFRARHFMLAFAGLMLPVLLTLALTHILFAASPADFVPDASEGTMTDGIVYWLETHAARVAGLDSGYFTFNENTARATFSPYGAHGFVYPLLMGGIARVTGWAPSTPVLLHVGLLGMALAAAVLLLRPTLRHGLMLLAGVLLTWPVLLFAASAMQESLHHAGAIMLGALLVHFLRTNRRWPLNLALVLLVLLSLLRPTWALVFLPLMLWMLPRRRVLAVMLGGGLFVAFVVLFALSTAPYYQSFNQFFLRQAAANPSPLFLANILLSYFMENVARLFAGQPLAIVQRLVVLMLVLGSAISAGRGRVFARMRRRLALSLTGREALFHGWQLGMLLLLHLVVYVITDFIDYRIMGVHVLLSIVLLAGMGRLRLLAGVLVLQVLLFPAFVEAYRVLNAASYSVSPTRLNAFAADLPPGLTFAHDAPNRWCNTVLSDVLSAELTMLPAGIGLSTLLAGGPLETPVQSRWLLLTDAGYAVLARAAGDALNVHMVTESAVGTWYLNRDAACD